MSSGSARAANSMEEVNMTAEEVHRFTRALQSHTFREMLHDYAREISDPDNRKRYEEEIQLLEQEKGNTVEFIHPKPFRVIQTSVDGNKKCFINICSNEKVGKPESKSGVSEEGHRGQCWSLPHSLHPGRQDTDGKGNKIVIYDVVFHPDTLHIASKNKRFMDMVDNTAVQGIQGAFKVSVDPNNVKEMRTKYKGVPQPCVIRKPTPGFEGREPSALPDPLAFPYPDQTSSKRQTNSEDSPSAKHKSDADPENTPIQSVKPKQPTKPNYTLKYRSFVDLQDFRCSRDSGRSPRPKEIVVTIDLPLLKSVGDASLEVTDKVLLLESQRPSYRLELPLAYPVDEDKGDAKFNRQKRQLTVTLPVLPLKPAVAYSGKMKSGSEDESEETSNRDEKYEKSEEEGPGAEETNRKQLEENQDVIRESGVQQDEEEDIREVMLENQDKSEVDVFYDGAAEEKDCVVTGRQCDASVCSPGGETSAVISYRPEASAQEEQLTSISLQYSCGVQEEVNPADSFKFLEVQKKPEEETEQANLQVALTASVPSNMEEENHRVPEAGQTSSQEPATQQASKPTEGRDREPVGSDREPVGSDREPVGSDREPVAGSDREPAAGSDREPAAGSDREPVGSDREPVGSDREPVGSDREPAAGSDREPVGSDREPAAGSDPAVSLREVDEDGNETVISDHSTSAGFVFHNSLMFELD